MMTTTTTTMIMIVMMIITFGPTAGCPCVCGGNSHLLLGHQPASPTYVHFSFTNRGSFPNLVRIPTHTT